MCDLSRGKSMETDTITEENSRRTDIFVDFIVLPEGVIARIAADRCFYCKGDRLIEYCMQFPCGDCVMICDECIEDALTNCECGECETNHGPIIQYAFEEQSRAWLIGAREHSSDY